MRVLEWRSFPGGEWVAYGRTGDSRQCRSWTICVTAEGWFMIYLKEGHEEERAIQYRGRLDEAKAAADEKRRSPP